MTVATARNGFAPPLHRLSLWTTIKKLIGHRALAKSAKFNYPKKERGIFTPSSDGLN
jgi:hypothetical protein